MLRTNLTDVAARKMQSIPAARTAARPAAPVGRFIAAGAVVATGSSGIAALTMPDAGLGAPLIAGAAMGVVITLGAIGLRRKHPHARLGPANLVTMARAGITALAAAALYLPGGLADRPMLAWSLVGIVAVGLALDGVDGWLARRTGLASAFGARFDMEVDAALAAVLCLLAILGGKAGLWLLPLGFLRYGWVATGMILPWLTGELPERTSRKAVCVVQIGVLTALLAPALVQPWAAMIAVAATVALAWSFAVDAVWLWRQ